MYGGAAGGGKSDALLAAALQYVDVPGYAALILRRTFKQLSLPGAIMARSKEWLKPHKEVHWSDDEKTWTFPSGATLTFGYLDTADDIYRYQGPEFQYVGFDELTQFNEAQYTYLFSRVRRRVGIPAPVRIRAASNPGGIGHAWVKTRFPIAVDDTPDRKNGRIFIPAKVSDNPGLDADEYAESLSNLGEILRSQLLNGDWGAFEGAAYPWYSPLVHTVKPFKIPDGWERFESLDYGSTNPTAILAYAVDFDSNIFVFDCIYQPGLPSEIAPLLEEKRARWWESRDQRGQRIANTNWADPSIWNKLGATNKFGRPASTGDEFHDHGITLARANNDRRAGYIRVAELLKANPQRRFPASHHQAGEAGAPQLYVFGTPQLEPLREQLQAAPLEGENETHPGEAVSGKWEGPYGHAHASLRYGVMSRPSPSTEPKQVAADPRRAFLDEVNERDEARAERSSRRRYVA